MLYSSVFLFELFAGVFFNLLKLEDVLKVFLNYSEISILNKYIKVQYQRQISHKRKICFVRRQVWVLVTYRTFLNFRIFEILIRHFLMLLFSLILNIEYS